MGYTLVYDSGCGPCTRFKGAVSFLDPRHQMRYLGIDEAESQGVLAGVPEPRRRSSFHLVSGNGTALSGSGALSTLASQLPGGLFASAAMRSVPPVSGTFRFAYSVLSRLHEKGSCTIG